MDNSNLAVQIDQISSGDQELFDFLRTFMRKPVGLKAVLKFGDELLLIKKDICKNDMVTFKRTMELISEGVFTDEEIHYNLSLEKPICFIDETITSDLLIPFDNEEFHKDNWESLCNNTKLMFQKKLKEQQEKTSVL